MATRNKTSINKEQYELESVQRRHITKDIGLIRNHKVGVLYYAGETIAKLFTDINDVEYVKTYTVLADFTGSSNFANDLTNYLVDMSTIQDKADKVGTGFTNQVASLDSEGNLQASGFAQSGLHTHSNLGVLDAISNAGSGAIITTIERNKLNGIEASAQNNLIADVGATGVSVYRDKTGSTFNLRKLDSFDSKLTIAIDTDRVLFTLNEANISLNADQIVFTDTNSYLNATDVQAAIENLALQTRANTWRIGDNAAGDKYLQFAISAGPNDPGFRFKQSSSKLQYSDDGTTWNDFVPVTAQQLTGSILLSDLSFTGTTPPSGALEIGEYKIIRSGYMFQLIILLQYATPGVGITETQITISKASEIRDAALNAWGVGPLEEDIFGIGHAETNSGFGSAITATTIYSPTNFEYIAIRHNSLNIKKQQFRFVFS